MTRAVADTFKAKAQMIQTFWKDLQVRLRINGVFSQVLKYAVEENYPEAKLVQDFIEICGADINPTMSMQKLSKGHVAAIFALSRYTIKENMSPKRNIDV